MTKQDIYNLVVESIHGGTLSPSLFDVWLNEMYQRALRRIHKKDPNRDVVSVPLPLDASTKSCDLPEDTGTLLEVFYYDPVNMQDDEHKVVIPPTDIIENRGQSEFRCYRALDVLHFRGYLPQITEVFISYRMKLHRLNANGDEVQFDEPDNVGMLVDYVLGRYYDHENMETQGAKFLASAEYLLKEMLAEVKPERKQRIIHIKVRP